MPRRGEVRCEESFVAVVVSPELDIPRGETASQVFVAGWAAVVMLEVGKGGITVGFCVFRVSGGLRGRTMTVTTEDGVPDVL